MRISSYKKINFIKENSIKNTKLSGEKKRFGLIKVMVRTLFFTKIYKNLSKPNIGIYRIGSKSEPEIHFEPCPNGKEVNFYGEISFTI